MIGYDEEDGLLGQFIYGETTPGFEGELWKHYWQNSDYAVSTFGRVWSCKSKIFLKPANINRAGHLAIHMHYLGTGTHVLVHRMVAETFIPNPDNLPVVRHLDGDPTNNTVWNLAWGTYKDNWEDSIRHGTFRWQTAENLEKANEKSCAARRQPVIAISESDESRTWFPSQREAARELNLYQSNINSCLTGRYKQTGGYSFIYAEAEEGGEANADR